MARQISGQYSISATDTTEKAIDKNDPNGDIIRVRNTGSNAMWVGNDGLNSVNSNSGYKLESGDTVAIRLKDIKSGGLSNVYVYGTSGDTLNWITIA